MDNDKNIEFIEKDVIGEKILQAINKAKKFNRWMYKSIKPFCQGEVLEIGSGIGNISTYFLQDKFHIVLSDIRKNYYRHLQQRFQDFPNLNKVVQLDITDINFDAKYKDYFNTFETIFALNVIEHIQDDTLALKNCNKLLIKGGRIIILVPSYQYLFNKIDIGVGHYRRYTNRSLSKNFESADFDVVHRQYFNFMGIFGWYFNGNILKKEVINGGMMSLYDFFIPIFRLVDKMIFHSMGLSTIVVGKKRN